MIRRLEVLYETDGEAPKVILEGEGWNAQGVERAYISIRRGLKEYKHKQIKDKQLEEMASQITLDRDKEAQDGTGSDSPSSNGRSGRGRRG